MKAESPSPGRIHSREWSGSFVFTLSMLFLICASLFAGAMLRPAIESWTRPSVPSSADLAAFLEHASVDVRLGRASPLAKTLGTLASQVKEPAVRERILGLWTEAALQAQRLADAATSEEAREPLVSDPAARSGIRLRRVGLAVALGQKAQAEELARPLIATGGDPLLADEARLRLLTGMDEKELRGWVAAVDPNNVEDARRAGLGALRLLGDAAGAVRLLVPLERGGQHDAGIYQALVQAYSKLEQHKDLARVAAALAEKTQGEDERARLVFLEANALASAGDLNAALAAVEPLRRSQMREVRQVARRVRYELLRKAGRLVAEVALLRDPAERAFIALDVERDYAEAARLYGAASAANPDSIEYAEGLREAERRRDLAERRTLYEQVLRKDPEDQATREKLLSVFVGLGDIDATRKWVGESLQGREGAPDALVSVGMALKRAGLTSDGLGLLEKAYAVESDASKKQQILFALGELYAEAHQEADARRLYTSLAVDGSSVEIRERAALRLMTLYR